MKSKSYLLHYFGFFMVGIITYPVLNLDYPLDSQIGFARACGRGLFMLLTGFLTTKFFKTPASGWIAVLIFLSLTVIGHYSPHYH